MTDSIQQTPGPEMPSMRLDGKVALITGASKGIGLAMAWALATSGAKVAISSRNQETLDECAEQMRAANLDVFPVAAKVGEEDFDKRLVEKVVGEYQGIDILVNNAATNPVYGPLMETSLEAFDKIFNVNLRGPFALSKTVQPIMAERGGGSVVHVASVAGISPWQGIGTYSVSKTALIGLTKVMASEWGRFGIRVNCICPGLIQTKFSKALWANETLMNAFKKNLSIRRVGQPEDLMALAVFLASEASSYCTGSVFTADGGLTI